MKRYPIFGLAALMVLIPAAGWADAPNQAAVDRGRLNLAWDAHESGLCPEALGYLADIRDASPVATDAAWLKAECLYDLGRYAEAVGVLASGPALTLPDREDFLLDVFQDWVWDATSREAYGEALDAARSGIAHLPGNRHLTALAEATRFRQAAAQALASGRGSRSSSGDVQIRRRGAAPPKGEGWTQAYPWGGHLPWVPQSTLEDWMPSLAAELDADGRTLWVRVPSGGLRGELHREARAAGLEVRREAEGFRFSAGGEEILVEAGEWAYRGAAEGLGLRGAAIRAVAETQDSLRSRSELSRWVQEHRGQLEVSRSGSSVRVRNPETRRSFDLDLSAWAEGFSPQSKEWAEFWSDLTAELGRPPRPFRCFCGRDVQLRETLAANPLPLAAADKGEAVSTVLIAICPLHQQLVTSEVLESWGVDWGRARARAREDAVTNTWDVSFGRGEIHGTGYVVFEGEGVSGLARHPDLLLGALEALDGVGAGGRTVRVVAPSASSLVVSADSEVVAEAGAAKVLLAASRRGEKVSKLGYRATVRLPTTGLGSFRLRPAE